MVTFDARAGKWLALALLVSLGANMFMGGLLAGRFARTAPEPDIAGPGAGGGPGTTGPGTTGPGGAGPGTAGPGGSGQAAGPGPLERPIVTAIRRMAATLPDDERARFEQAFAERRRDIGRATLATREARFALRDAIMADPFDRGRVEQAFAQLRARNDDVQRLLHAIALDAIARLPKESRQALANWAQPPRAVRPAQRPGPAAPGGAPGGQPGGQNAPGARP